MPVRESLLDTAADRSIQIRLEMWLISIDLIREKPVIGYGILASQSVIQSFFGQVHEHSHNQYLSWMLSGGFILLILGFYFLTAPVWISKNVVMDDRLIIILATSFFLGCIHDF
jgi:O-antigen ligase